MSDVFDSMKEFVSEKPKEKAEEIKSVMQGVVHVKSGALRDSIRVEKKGNGNYLVGVDEGKLVSDGRNIGRVNYVKYYYDGSDPHIIRPKKPGGVLRWIGKDGKEHFAKYVSHPGNKPHDFISETLSKIK